jgi:hypothetical protein
MTDYRLDNQTIGVRVPPRIFASPYHPDQFWCPANLLYDGYREFFLRVTAAGL